MNKLLTGILVFSVISLSLTACGGQAPVASPSDAYDYPVKPGTQAWKDLPSHDEMLRVCQVPEDILLKMSTAGLVETVLNYPLFADAWVYNDPQSGFNAISSRFNGIPELIDRDDGGTAVLERYRILNPAAIENDWTSLQKGQFSWSIADVEMLLAQNDTIARLKAPERNDLMAEALVKYEAKQQRSDIYSKVGLEHTAWVLGRALQQADYAPFAQKIQDDEMLRMFVDKGSFSDAAMMDEIVAMARQYLAGK